MPLSRPAPVRGSSPPGGGKRRRGRPKGSRGRKRQKRLDSIRDTPGALHPRPQSPENDGTVIRRSSRVRRAPAFLDSSPAPPRRRKKRKIEGSPGPTGSRARGGRRGRNSERRGNRGQEEGDSGPLRAEDATSGSPLQETKDSKDEVEDWRSRLRSRIGERKGRSSSFGGGAARKENESLKKVSSETGSGSQTIGSSRRGRRRVLSYEVNANIEETKCQIEFLPSSDQEESGERAPQEEDLKIVTDSLVYSNEEIEPSLPSEEVKENANFAGAAEVENLEQFEEETKIPDQQLGDNKQENEAIIMNGHLDGKPFENEDVVKEDNLKASVADKKLGRKHIKEGRRCGLCGGGAGGRPPKRLAHESSGSDNEAYEGSSASEEPNYDIWDGFGDEPEWLGRLLGPIIDRFGIPRVWVHQHCAVWSPEVYFAGLGCLKNVRAALCRGRALKCSRCGRPGATIGCRVDRCPKTYHLPCSRADGCIFDHRKFLIACHEHRHLFQPLGNDRAQHVKIMKFKKLKFDMRRLSHDAWRRDLEAEEKWLENCGEDEEFLKREGRRLQRDLFRIAPVYIGGSENEKLFQGWESVAGLQDVINCMKEVVILPLLYPEIFNTLGLTPPRGVLLHGHPGTGKTLVVRALIGACSRGDKRIAYFARKGADCLGKYVGDAERQLRLLFQVAERCQPSIIFFDEIDGLAPCRSRNQDQTHNSVVSTLLSLLDGLKSRGSVIVIGATNRPDAVDPALRRPGRFDREIYFPLPKLNDRSAILSLHTRSWPNPVSGPLLSWIANNTAGYAGADLQALCTQAAMNALKRSCALEELLSSAEKLSDYGKLPSLPSFTVEERDWLVALAAAPPPCSRREAGIAANDIVSSPLHSHLIACLLKPLSELLISFYMDERIWLPPALVKASELIKSVITTALEQEKVSTGLWRSHLHSLINQPSIAKEIEKILCRYGLVTGRSGCDQSYILDKDNNDCKDLDADRSKPAYFETPSKSKLKSVELGKSTGFHVLVAGTPRSGQQHLASSLLHGFSGHLEIQNVNLATMSLEGHGDIVRGLTQTLLKCLNGGRCMVFMPRIDLWAIETVRKEAEPTDTYQDTQTMSSVSEVDMTRIASEAWNLFIEQVESGTAASSLIIMATCEMQTHVLPLGIRKFFTNDVREDGGSIPSRHSVPRFSVNVDGNFSHDVLISSCASKLSEDLVQNYVQLMHHYSHMDYRHDGIQTFQTMETSSEPGHAILPTVKQMDPEQVAATGEATWIHNQKQQHAGTDPVITRGNVNIDVQHNRHEASIPKTLSKNVKGGSLLAIATFGYQILRSPHFAELCWVTSKLKEGPYIDVNGTRKHWPFSSCLVNTCSSPEKVVFSGLNNNNKDTELSGSVRGLMAVGLLAYRGNYTSVQEVSSEVRKVLELLVGKIRLRISAGKDAFRYFRILSQVAYLEDIVNSWAYNFRSLPAETYRTTPNTNPRSLGDEPVDIEPNESPILKITSRMPVDSNCNEQVTLITGDPHKFSNDVEGFISQPLSSPNHCVLEKGEPFPLAPPSDLHSSSAAWTALPSANGTNGSEGSIVKNLDAKVRLSSTESSRYFLLDTCNVYNQDKETTACSTSVVEPCNGSENLISSCTAAIVTGELDSTANLANTGSSRLSKALDVSCLYCCCCSCLPDLYVLLRRILSDSWRSSGHCSTIDDLHDILASRSVNILATVRRCFYSPNSSANRQHLQSEQSDSFQCDRCACPIDIFQQLQKMNGECTFDKVGFLPAECFSHLSNKNEVETANFETGSVAPVLKFFFKDGVLMPTDTQTGIQFHCRFEKICLSAVVQMILVNEQQFD